MPRLLAERLDEALERRHEAEVVERLRAQLDREPADVLERARRRARAARPAAASSVGRSSASSTRLQPEQDRRQRLPGLVVQLAREPLPLELLRADDAAQRVAGDALGEVDGDGRACGEGLGQAQVLVGEARRRCPPCRARRSRRSRRSRSEQRHVEPGPGARSCRAGLLVDLEVVDHRVDALAAPPLEHASRSSTLAARAAIPSSSSAPSPSLARTTRSPSRAGSAIRTSRACTSSRSRAATSSSSRASSTSDASALADLVQGLELLEPTCRRLVEPRVLDRDRGLGGEQRRRAPRPPSVNVAPSGLLGQVQVPVRDPAQQDRHAEERVHRRVVRREPDRARILAEVVEPQRPRVA